MYIKPTTARRPHILAAHNCWRTHLNKGDHVVDATLGGGYDTLFLAQLLQGEGKLTAYDIQEQALDISRKRLQVLNETEREIVTLKHASHAIIEEEQLALVVYNLGYLPSGDHNLTTLTETTLHSLDSALKALKPGGILSITCYPGHPEGSKEQQAVLEWCKQHPHVQHSFWGEKRPSWHLVHNCISP